MKHTTIITKTLIALMGFTFMLTSCSSWRYNKQQRVQIEKQDIPSTAAQSDPNEQTGPSVILTEEGTAKQLANNATITYGEQENLKLVKKKDQKTSKSGSINDKKNQSPFKSIIDQFQRHDKQVNKSEEVEKTELSGWVRIMVILFVVGFILLLIGIFLSIFVSGAFWWLFYAVGALLILAGFIVLILGLVGLI